MRKAAIRFVMSACLHATTQLPLDGFLLNLVYNIFKKSIEKIQGSLKYDKNNAYFT
jgi:hypothetical protein